MDCVHFLTVTHGLIKSYVRCWYCDLKESIGWRRGIRTIDDGLNRYYKNLKARTVEIVISIPSVIYFGD